MQCNRLSQCNLTHRIREIGTNKSDGTPIPDGQLSRYNPEIWGTLYPYDPITANGENWMQFRTRIGIFIEFLIRSFDNHSPETSDAIAEQSILVDLSWWGYRGVF